MRRYLTTSTILLALLGSLHSRAVAADRAELTAGMSMAEVLTRWGEPNERVEQESRRREIWVYAGTAVTFHQGVLVEPPALPAAATLKSTHRTGEGSPAASGAHRPVVAPPSPLSQDEMPAGDSDVIGEVLRDMPADDDKSRGGSRAAGRSAPSHRPTPAGLLPPMMPPQEDNMGMEDTP